MKTLLFVTVLLAGCGAQKAPINDDEVAGLDEKADTFSTRWKIVGSLKYGESATTSYTSTPRYRAFKFAGQKGDKVNIWVQSSAGDSVAWLLDAGKAVVSSNDDADQSTYDSNVVATLPSSGNFYIVLRDYDLASHYFTVTLNAEAAAPSDCRTSGCSSGKYCSKCFGDYVCIANNTIC
jgi:hypothetical protein